MKLYFAARDEERLIAEPSTPQECRKEIQKFMDDRNFKSYYTRVWEENGRVWFDVGSHTEFFIVDGSSMSEFSG